MWIVTHTDALPFVPVAVRGQFDPEYRTLAQRQADQAHELLLSLSIQCVTCGQQPGAHAHITTKAPSQKD